MAGFTQNQYEKAQQVELIDYLEQNGYYLKKVGTNEYTLEEHDSIRINPLKNTFFWNSRNVGGSTIQFLQYYEGKSFVDAVKILSGEQVSTTITNRPKYTPKTEEKGELILPEKNEDNKRAIAYLTKSRKLDFEIVNSLIKSGNIYESKENHNVIFVGKNNGGVPKYASKRSTLTNSAYKGDVKNSDKDFGFRIKGDSNRVYVFESAIDLITHASISKHLGNDWKKANRVSLGCLAFKSMDNFLKDNENIKEIVLFLDNDVEGQKNAQKFYKNYGNEYDVNIICVKNKDLNQTWQDYLNDLENDKSIKFKDYIEYGKKPFLEPKLKNEDILKEHLKQISKEDTHKTIDYLFKNKMIALSEDDKAILFIKNDKGENIGGYKIDIFNKKLELEIIENSEEKPLLINKEKEALIITNNFFESFALKDIFNVIYVNSKKDLLGLEKVIDENKNIKNVFIQNYVDISEISDNIKDLSSKYEVNINVVNDYEKNQLLSFVFKEDFLNEVKEICKNEQEIEDIELEI